MSERLMSYPEWQRLMQSEDGEFYLLSDYQKMDVYWSYLYKASERKLIGNDFKNEMEYKKAFESAYERNKQANVKIGELLRIINSIKNFCEYEANIYSDLVKENSHNLKWIRFKGKQEAFNNVLSHIKNLENS